METTVYHFQNPNNGEPLVLKLNSQNQPEVESVEDHSTSETDVKLMNEHVSDYKSLHEAARFLARTFDCKDILS